MVVYPVAAVACFEVLSVDELRYRYPSIGFLPLGNDWTYSTMPRKKSESHIINIPTWSSFVSEEIHGRGTRQAGSMLALLIPAWPGAASVA